jgi:hypothetical protein
MATIRVKARPKAAEGKNQRPASIGDSPAPGKGVASKAAGDGQASCGSLREYLKANH